MEILELLIEALKSLIGYVYFTLQGAAQKDSGLDPVGIGFLWVIGFAAISTIIGLLIDGGVKLIKLFLNFIQNALESFFAIFKQIGKNKNSITKEVFERALADQKTFLIGRIEQGETDIEKNMKRDIQKEVNKIRTDNIL